MAACPLKMVAICAALVIILSIAGQQPAMAYDDGAQSGLACPSAVTTCRTECTLACNAFSRKICDGVCRITQSQAPLAGLAQTCVNQATTPCMGICKNLCEPVPVKNKSP